MIYELRVYKAMPGRLPDLLRRFQDETLAIWEKHGIRQAGFWTTLVGDSNVTLTYMLAWESMSERDVKWNAFLADPDWVKVRVESEKNGFIVASIVNQILQPTAFSAVK